MDNRTALIVDDSQSACAVLSRILSQYNVTSESKFSGQDALEYLQNNQPSIIFMDHSMPDMDGFQAIKMIRKSLRLDHIPIYMFTARNDENYLKLASKIGASGVLPKALDSDSIKKILQSAGIIVNPEMASVSNQIQAPSSEEKMQV